MRLWFSQNRMKWTVMALKTTKIKVSAAPVDRENIPTKLWCGWLSELRMAYNLPRDFARCRIWANATGSAWGTGALRNARNRKTKVVTYLKIPWGFPAQRLQSAKWSKGRSRIIRSSTGFHAKMCIGRKSLIKRFIGGIFVVCLFTKASTSALASAFQSSCGKKGK